MKRFIDWSRTKQVVVVDEKGNAEQVSVKKFKIPEGAEVYLEAGFSMRLIMKMMDQGCVIYRTLGQNIAEFRGEKEKTDMGDAQLIREAYLQNPDMFKKVERPSELEFRLHSLMTQYRQVTKDVASFKNRIKAIEWEYGEVVYKGILGTLESLQKEIFKQIEPLIAVEYDKLKHIKGLGPKTLAKLLASAHPRDFLSLSAYLAYCGCKASSFYKRFEVGQENGKNKGRGRFSRQAKSAIWFASKGVLMAKDEKYYPLYKKVRTDLESRGIEKLVHTKALNRVQTFLLKEIYHEVHGVEPLKTLREA